MKNLLLLLLVVIFPCTAFGQVKIQIEPTNEEMAAILAAAQPKIKFNGLMKSANSILNEPVFAEYLRITDTQRQSITKVVKEFNDELERLNSVELLKLSPVERKAYMDQHTQIRNTFEESIREIILPFQFEELVQFTGRGGSLPKSLLLSPAYSFAGLSDEQRDKMKGEFNKLSEEMEEILKRKREQAYKVWTDNLTKVQLEKFEKLQKTEISDVYKRIGFDVLLWSIDMRPKQKAAKRD